MIDWNNVYLETKLHRNILITSSWHVDALVHILKVNRSVKSEVIITLT